MVGLYTTPPVYYVKPDGIDAPGRGTFEAPWKTISYANSNATSGWDNIICLRKGIYQLSIPINLVHPIIGYPGEDITIDGQGVANYLFSYDAERATYIDNYSRKERLMFQNIRFTGYTQYAIYISRANYAATIYNQCFFKPFSRNTSAFKPDITFGLRLLACTFISMNEVTSNDYYDSYSTVKNCIFWDINAFQISGIPWTTTFNAYGNQYNNAYPGATKPGCFNSNTGTFDTDNFINPSNRNYAVKPNSVLRGAGTDGINIGATFGSNFQIGSAYTNFIISYFMNSTDWSNDPLWWNETLNSGLGGPGTAADIAKGINDAVIATRAIYVSESWRVDTTCGEDSNTARIRSKVYDLGESKTFQALGWSAYEDELLPTGHKAVFDNTIETDTREIEYRGNQSTTFDPDADDTGLTIGWTQISKHTDMSSLPSVRHIQIRIIISKMGK